MDDCGISPESVAATYQTFYAHYRTYTALIALTMNWNYKQPVEIHFGTGILNDLKELTAKSGYFRGLLVTSPSFVKRGVVDRLSAFFEEARVAE